MIAFIKDPAAILDYIVDWESWLASGESISSVTWTVDNGLTNISETNTTTSATIWVSGGSTGSNYDLNCQITTDQGRTDARSFRILVRVQ